MRLPAAIIAAISGGAPVGGVAVPSAFSPAVSALPAPKSGSTRTTAASAGTRRRRRTTYGTTEDPPLSGAYGVSCRARAERAALGLVMSPFAPGRPSTGRPSGGSPAPHQAD